MQRKEWTRRALVFVAASLLLAGCGSTASSNASSGSTGGSSRSSSSSSSTSSSSSSSSTSSASSGGSSSSSSSSLGGVPSTLVVDETSSPSNLDPGQQWNTSSYIVYRNIFDQLVTRNAKTLKIEPDVATSWKAVSPTTWQFTIRSGIEFSNGTPLTAKDVVFSLRRILNPKYASPQASNYHGVSSVSASGNLVTIKTRKPDPTLLSFLTILSIVPQKYVQAHGDSYFNLHPVGSGPYMLKQWQQGSKVVLVQNQKYWGKKPIFKSVEFRAVPDEATRIADLKAGTADIAFSVNPDQVATIKNTPGLKAIIDPTERVAYLAFNTDQAPTNSLLVRRAIVYALDRPLMIKTLENGYGAAVNAVLARTVWGYNKNLPAYSYDVQMAKKLLKQANYKGQPVSFATSPAYPQLVVQAVQQQLGQVGIKVTIDKTTQATYLQHVQSPQHTWGNIRMGQWSCSCLDGTGTIYPLFYSHSIWSSFSNAAYDKAITTATSSLDNSVRSKAMNQALTVLHQQVPGVGLWQADALYGVNKHIAWDPGPEEEFFVNQIGWN